LVGRCPHCLRRCRNCRTLHCVGRAAQPGLARALALLAYFVISIAYAIALEWFWRGQTVGKRLFHLRVIDSHGFRLRFSQIAMRNLLRSIDMLPLCYLVGGLAALRSGKAQRLGDLAAGTVVIRELPAVEPELDRIAPAKYNSLDAYPHLAARLRTSTTAEAAAIAVRALMQGILMTAGAAFLVR
jgi:hypothetical protein